MKIKRIIKFILIILVTIGFMQFISNNKVEAASKPNLKVSYSYNSKKDTVTVKVKSNKKLKNTKPSWTLSKDKKTYSKKFYANQTYSTNFKATNGKSKNIKIKVKQIKGPKIKISYKYNSKNNKVKVTVKSNKKMKNNKPSWTLSKDKKSYTKTFKTNENYKTNFYDTYGNKAKIKIKVTQVDQIAPKLKISYKYNPDKKVMVVTVVANEKLKENKPSWKLSKDKKIYTKNFSSAQSYKTYFEDLYGNKTRAKINVKEFDKTNPTATMKYSYNSVAGYVTVKIVANEKLANTKPTWTLSSDKKTYTKKFKSEYENYSTIIEDLVGNKTTVKIKFDYRKKLFNGIDVSYYQRNVDWTKVKKSGKVDFAILRAGYRGYGSAGTLVEDAEFAKHLIGTKSNNIDVGLYFFTQAVNKEEAKQEANYVISLIKKYGIKVKYPIAIDTEISNPNANGRADGLSVATRTEVVKEFCKTIKNAGYIPAIYASTSWFNNKLDMSKLLGYDKWVAHYPISGGKQTGDNTPSSKESANTCAMWQYTSVGSVDGISGSVDRNYCYKRY